METGYERKPSCRLEAHNQSELATSKGFKNYNITRLDIARRSFTL